MCGIVGSIGFENSNEIVLTGLRRLEYRGYDSCGICYKTDSFTIKKSIKRIKDLSNQVTEKSSISLGHTRWATHGGVNLENAHPHTSSNNKFVIIHNGVIENYNELRKKYCSDITFKSQTDTEVLVELIAHFYEDKNDINDAICKFMDVVDGSYACILYSIDNPNKLYAIKNKSPMLIGKAKVGYTISSDPSAVIDKVDTFYQIADKKFIVMDEISNSATLYNNQNIEEDMTFEKIDMDFEEVSTENYDTFMLKEIEEQPKALRNMVENYRNLKFDENLIKSLKTASKIYIIASGTSYHSGLATKRLIQEKLNIPVENVLGSEFGYDNNIIDNNSFFIFLSQSGETADSMLVFNQIIGKYPILAITNVRGSQMDRNADYSLQLFAGIEVAVASTKAYTAQIAMVTILLNVACNNLNIYDELLKVADCQEKIINDKDKFKELANIVKDHKEAFYLGRLVDYALCQEAALKVKEVSYINVNAFAAGELKHGTISLIDTDTLILSIISDSKIAANTRSNLEEVKSRGAKVITFSTSKTAISQDDYVVDYDFDDSLLPILLILPHQYLSYYTATLLNLDVDKPRNLAKSVTVE